MWENYWFLELRLEETKNARVENLTTAPPISGPKTVHENKIVQCWIWIKQCRKFERITNDCYVDDDSGRDIKAWNTKNEKSFIALQDNTHIIATNLVFIIGWTGYVDVLFKNEDFLLFGRSYRVRQTKDCLFFNLVLIQISEMTLETNCEDICKNIGYSFW